MTTELLVTEHDLEQLRVAPAASARLSTVSLSTRVESAEHLWQVVLLVLARAGQATPPGRYVQINGRWTLYPNGFPAAVFKVSNLACSMVEEARQAAGVSDLLAANPAPPESDSKGGPTEGDPTPMLPDESGSEPPQS